MGFIWNSNIERNKPLGRNKERAKKERERAYGPVGRRRMVRRMQCCVEGCYNQSENAHIEGGGMGRKAHYTKIAPLCGEHHRFDTHSFHNLGSAKAFDAWWGTNLEKEAKGVEDLWQRSQLTGLSS